MRQKTEIFTIYGQIEGVIALEMVGEMKFNKIERDHIPPGQAFNEHGHPALFAVVAPLRHLAEFERRVKALRA
jgi:hypothetical protein